MEPTATTETSTEGTEAQAATNGGAAAGIEVLNPATGQPVATVPAMSPAEVTAAVERARAAQPEWAALGFEGRGRVLRRTQKWLTDNTERVVETVIAESGKVYEDAFAADVAYTTMALGFWAKQAPKYLADERVRSGSPFVLGRRLVIRYAPVGVAGVIGPWNYPLANSLGDCIPALAAGNSVVLKPASLTPMTSLLIAEAMRECGLPESVLEVAVGEGSQIGNALIDAVDSVMFTGSTEVGRKVAERAAKTLTPCTMELGGKDPMIVLRDADLERAANAAVHYAMFNSGQTCISVERVYVEEPVYEEFVAKLVDKVRAIRQGAPGAPGSVDVGAMTSPEQTELVAAHVADAIERGARAVVGGNRGTGSGDFFEPTLLVDVDHSMRCMTEETFGPTLPVMRVASADEAIGLANDSPLGLQASVWSGDAKQGEAVARRVEAGAVCVNDAVVNYSALELPMGGWKDSGLGNRHGANGIRKYTKQQSLLVTRFAPMSKDIHMLPYRRSVTRLLGRMVKLLYGRGRRD